MRVIGNILWLLFAGVWLALGYLVAGVIALVLIITIPFAFASWRLAGYALWPFGRTVVARPTAGVASVVGNVLWFLVAGWWLALVQLLAGLLLCVTVIGIPFGVASFKMAGLAIAPLGKEIVPHAAVERAEQAVVAGPAPLGH
jgi:uncharacterized membrane protein YccF (DUF307 family)